MTKLKPDLSKTLGRRSNHRNPKTEAIVAAVQEEEKKRLHAFIPASLHKKLRLQAATQDRDMTEIIVEALTNHLKD